MPKLLSRYINEISDSTILKVSDSDSSALTSTEFIGENFRKWNKCDRLQGNLMIIILYLL